jgi:replicative DNA helicase
MKVNASTITELGRGFQLDLFHELITDTKFGETVIDKLEASHFNVEAYQKLIIILKKYFEKHETILNFPNLKTEIQMQVPESTLRLQLIDTVVEIESIKVTNKNVQEFATKFVKLQTLKNVLQEISKKVEKGHVEDYDLIEKKLKDALIFKEVEDAITIYHELDDVLADDYREPIPTGIEGIDEIMNGGLAKQELALVIAPLGVGKTSFLTKVANTAYQSGKNVLQIFFEDKAKPIQRKHYSIMSKIPTNDLGLNREAVTNRVRHIETKLKKKYDNNLFLQKLPADGVTITKIKNIIKKLNAKGHKIDLLILDYVDCLSLERETSGTEEWSNEGKIMRLLETMIEEMDVACWTATQGNRSSTGADVVKTENMGGSLKKAQIAHFIMSIAKGLEQKEANLATIAILKNRLGKDGMVFENCVFNNGTLEIDTGNRVTINGMEKEKEKKIIEKNTKEYRALLEARLLEEKNNQNAEENNNIGE